MRIHKEIEKVKKCIIYMGTMVEEKLILAFKAIKERDIEMAQHIIDADKEIDLLELEIEEECLKVLALYQPVAKDLRYVVSMLKINNDLERVGDLVVNIAGRAINISSLPKLPELPFDVYNMADKSKIMLKQSIDTFSTLDIKSANIVCEADNEVDNLNREMYGKIETCIKTHPENLHIYLQYMSISKYLERIADHATNIAQDVIYLENGEIIRHKFSQLNR